MAITAHDREDQERVADFLHGLRDAQQEDTRRAVEHTAAILGAGVVWRAYKKFRRGS